MLYSHTHTHTQKKEALSKHEHILSSFKIGFWVVIRVWRINLRINYEHILYQSSEKCYQIAMKCLFFSAKEIHIDYIWQSRTDLDVTVTQTCQAELSGLLFSLFSTKASFWNFQTSAITLQPNKQFVFILVYFRNGV